ncbi:TetR/AcrR family transcriptional regulator [Actinoplanes sp. NBRC 101535]|uniref:TetR/AcrR family transcriptional regulator n=1 Tax=Actinoplanes sp. NBRC 101535 TaxID=3032196 RepID=UPI0024A5322C|nr:TetR/AcrR family transcriptional regulator [Actinoplanes sp. NBRC 101535]GLY06615.1 TetR family transcriptional regulator [Actinoplanes sp. NBRC 101535]
MATETERHPRADAARNAQRIVQAARTAFADDGPDVHLEEIARRAKVGIRTLYRHFPTKSDLVRAAIDQSFAERLTPAIEQAVADDDALRGFTTLIEAGVFTVARERNTLAAARTTGSPTADLSTAFFTALATLAGRAQQTGALRPDITTADLPRIMAMLVSVLWSTDPATEDWRRYLALLLDGLCPTTTRNLPGAGR